MTTARKALGATDTQLTYPLYHCEEGDEEADIIEMYTLILTGDEVIQETMTLDDYLTRADTKGTPEYLTADQHIPFIREELNEID